MQHKSLVADRWLTGILGRDAYCLIVGDSFATDIYNRTAAGYAFLQEVKRGPVFLYSRVSPALTNYVAFLEEEKFRLVDTTVTFEKAITMPGRQEAGIHIRFAVTEDADQTAALAKRAFMFSRFHLDPAFPQETADKIKGEWARNFFSGGRGNAMVIAEVDHRVAGFLQLLFGPEGTLIIDLIAVDERHRRKGIATGMIAYAESHCGHFETIRVGTQVANIPSLRFYERAGFLVSASNYVFHYHHPIQKEAEVG